MTTKKYFFISQKFNLICTFFYCIDQHLFYIFNKIVIKKIVIKKNSMTNFFPLISKNFKHGIPNSIVFLIFSENIGCVYKIR